MEAVITYESLVHEYTRWFKYDRDKLWLVYTQIVPVIFEPPCITCKLKAGNTSYSSDQNFLFSVFSLKM